MTRRLTTVFLVMFTLLFQSVSFAMPCCYGMSSSAGESMVKYLASLQAGPAQQSVMSDCGHQVVVDPAADTTPDSGFEEHPCPMASLVSSASSVLLNTDSLAFSHSGKGVLLGSFLTLPLSVAPFVIERPPRIS